MTGGTIDSSWSGIMDTAVVNFHSVIPEYFKKLVIYPKIKFTEVCMKDSRQINQKDIENVNSITNWKIRRWTINRNYAIQISITITLYYIPSRIVIPCVRLGVDKSKGQTIVFTGAMVPLEGVYPSDAAFNLGFALSKVQELKPGVYLCMNGETFTPQEVAKNLGEGRFYSVFKERNIS